jgi:hypothetical protein
VTEASEVRRSKTGWAENAHPTDESLAEAGDCGVNRIVHRPHQGKPWKAGKIGSRAKHRVFVFEM